MVISLFTGSLFTTFVIARFVSHLLHDKQGYGTQYEKSKTLTGWLRRRTGFGWHHYHFGFLIVFLTLMLSYFFGFNSYLIVFLGIGSSLFLDQISFLIFLNKNYFGRGYFGIRSLSLSIIFHLAIAFIFSSVNFG